MDREAVIEKVIRYSQLVFTVLKPNKIILFGLYAKGNWTEDSDIDVAIFVDKMQEDFLQLSTKLCNLTRTIDYRIEPILLEENNDPSGFISDIKKQGIFIFQKENSTNHIATP
jgi:predicted nucleotidyltransferase